MSKADNSNKKNVPIGLCKHCDHFVLPSESPHVHGYEHVTLKDRLSDHTAEPGGETHTVDEWRKLRPELFKVYNDGRTGPDSIHYPHPHTKPYTVHVFPVAKLTYEGVFSKTPERAARDVMTTTDMGEALSGGSYFADDVTGFLVDEHDKDGNRTADYDLDFRFRPTDDTLVPVVYVLMRVMPAGTVEASEPNAGLTVLQPQAPVDGTTLDPAVLAGMMRDTMICRRMTMRQANLENEHVRSVGTDLKWVRLERS